MQPKNKPPSRVKKKKRARPKKRDDPTDAPKAVKRVGGERLKPISLHGLDFEDVMRRLMTPPARGRKPSI